MPAQLLTFRRSVIPHDVSSNDRRNPSSSINYTNSAHNNRQSTSNGYHGNNSSNGYYGGRGRGGYGNYNRYNNHEGESAASQLRQQLQYQSRHRVPVYAASAATAASTSQQLQPTDKQEISEPATIIWCEGGIGEVMSPWVWRYPNLHVYFDASKTALESHGGWEGLRADLEPGMEMDVKYVMSEQLHGLLKQQLQQMQQEEEGERREETHTFIRIKSIAELRASRCSSVRTHEQAVVIAKRQSGAAFLINNSGERTVLHPNFLPVDGVRHAILEKVQGQRQISTSEVDDSPSSLCVLGRSLAVRLAPGPCWLPTIYDCDRGVRRWALSAEPYGEEKQGRAVVVQATRHSVSLCSVEGDLANKRTSLHAPIIQMTGQIKQDVQQVGSCWRFRACRELPGRSAVWRAFQLEYELDSDVPIAESVIESVLTGNRLIDLEEEEELPEIGGRRSGVEQSREEAERASSALDDLAQLQLVFAQPLAVAAAPREATPTQAPTEIPFNENDENVLIFDSIDDFLDSETFATDVFRAPSILPNEWMLLGVPPHEAVKTEQEMLLVDAPLVMRADEGEFGVFTTGDERPDMRVVPKKKKKRKSRRVESEDEDAPTRDRDSARPEAQGDSASHDEQMKGTADEQSAKDRKREMKEDYKLKQHLGSLAVRFATDGEDVFSLLHGGAKVEPTRSSPPPAATPPPVVARAAAAPVRTAAASGTSGNELFELFHGPAAKAAAAAPKPAATADVTVDTAGAARAAHKPVVAKINAATTGNDLFDLLHMGAKPDDASTSNADRRAEEKTAAAASVAPAAGAATAPPSSVCVVIGEQLTRPRAPKFAILPLPERPRFADGWWFRPSRPRPPPVQGKKEKRKERREAEEAWRRQQEEEEDESAPEASSDATEAYERRPADDMRARLLGALKKKKEEKPAESLTVVTATEPKKEEERDGGRAADENMLVDLSPVCDLSSPTAAAAADSAPLLQSPTELHDDLKDLF